MYILQNTALNKPDISEAALSCMKPYHSGIFKLNQSSSVYVFEKAVPLQALLKSNSFVVAYLNKSLVICNKLKRKRRA